ncbi:MAG: hypothetical protein RJA12_148, partial [Planctomycetota bacterium]
MLAEVPVSQVELHHDHEASHAHEGSSRGHQITILLAVVLPFVALATGAALAWGRGFDWAQLGIVLFMYFLSGLGVTLGYHR